MLEPHRCRFLWCGLRQAASPFLEVSEQKLSPASRRGFFCGRALCNQAPAAPLIERACWSPSRSAASASASTSGRQAHPLHGGLCNQLCGSALWWRACCRSRNPLQAGPFDDESPVPPAGLLFGAGRLCNQPASRPVDMVCSDWWGAARPLGPFEVAPPPAPRIPFRSDGVQHSDATLA